MRILQINNCHYRRGGADVVYLNTGELLEKLGHDVFYFSQIDKRNIKCDTETYFVQPIDFFHKSVFKKVLLLPRFFYSKESYDSLDKLIDKHLPEVAHIHTYKGTLTPSILSVLKKRSVPVVITLHDYGLICPHNSFLNGKEEICTKCYETGNAIYCITNRCNRNNILLSSISFLEYTAHKYLFPFHKYFDHLISVCNFSFNLHSKISNYSGKISQLYNFTPLLNERVSDTQKGDYFLFYGRLSKEKGIKTLLNAFIKLSSEYKLKIVGDGPSKEELLLFVSENSLSNIEFLGFRQRNDLIEIIRDASFVIVPSEVNENNPMTIVESYSLGKPVIGSNVGGIPEIIKNGKTGYLFEMSNFIDLGNVIKKAFSISQEEYNQLSINARNFAEKHFSEEAHYNALINIYKQIQNS